MDPAIRETVLFKLLFNTCMNPTGALTGLSYGELVSHPHTLGLIERLAEETLAVLAAEFDYRPAPSGAAYARETLAPAMLARSAGHRSSMLQDIAAGRRTEIDSLNGAVAWLGWQHGITTPTHDALIDLIGARRPIEEISAEIKDGDCLQIGIGGVPNAVCRALAQAGVKDLGINTEMLVDGLMELVKVGAATGSRKQVDVGKAVYAFAIGSRELYACIDRNPDFETRAVGYTNLPHPVSRNDNVVAVNSTGQMDLQGQAASESSGHRHFSGTGGQLGFVRAAYQSKDGRAFLCMPSTYERRGVRKSRVVIDLPGGTIVTVPRTDVMYAVTEYGMVCLKGKSVAERAKAMISIAHPDFREELEREAYGNGLIPRAYFWWAQYPRSPPAGARSEA
ncbi:acetyl-CoA hydrolase/transferase C-terminal domain-containing protein [Falsiroseomonas sp.]|uniref:acetyl-CoA hydrolase/transferase C-terminal domain-containing protein n=1 Tax=Falsiroseomonas sp. TaxID=2870721 RepID=UPI0035643305